MERQMADMEAVKHETLVFNDHHKDLEVGEDTYNNTDDGSDDASQVDDYMNLNVISRPKSDQGRIADKKTTASTPMKTSVTVAPRGRCQVCDCERDQRQWQDFPGLVNLLPVNYNYRVCKWVDHGGGKFTTTLRMDITETDDLLNWKERFEEHTKVTFRVLRTYPNTSGQKNIFRESYCCQHASKNKVKPCETNKKNTDCQTTLGITLKRIVKYSRSSDPHLPNLPTIIDLSWRHNHQLDTASALRYRDVSESTREEVETLLRMGHTPSSALNTYKTNLRVALGDHRFMFASGDRSIVPDYGYVHRLHNKIFGPPEETRDIGIKHEQNEIHTDSSERLQIQNIHREEVLEDVHNAELHDTDVPDANVHDTGLLGTGVSDANVHDADLCSTDVHNETMRDVYEESNVSNRLQEVTQGIQCVADILISKLCNDPDSMLGPCEQFLDNFKKLKTQMALQTSLSMFGSQTTTAESLLLKRKRWSMEREDRKKAHWS